jgi:hypothetical protein
MSGTALSRSVGAVAPVKNHCKDGSNGGAETKVVPATLIEQADRASPALYGARDL